MLIEKIWQVFIFIMLGISLISVLRSLHTKDKYSKLFYLKVINPFVEVSQFATTASLEKYATLARRRLLIFVLIFQANVIWNEAMFTRSKIAMLKSELSLVVSYIESVQHSLNINNEIINGRTNP